MGSTGTVYPTNTVYYGDIEVIFCPYCGTTNQINLNWYMGERGIRFCIVCGKEI